jgi:hypothetical protein
MFTPERWVEGLAAIGCSLPQHPLIALRALRQLRCDPHFSFMCANMSLPSAWRGVPIADIPPDIVETAAVHRRSYNAWVKVGARFGVAIAKVQSDHPHLARGSDELLRAAAALYASGMRAYEPGAEEEL